MNTTTTRQVCETEEETSRLKQVSYWRDFRTQLFGSTFGFLTTEDGTDKLSRNVDKKITATRCALQQETQFSDFTLH